MARTMLLAAALVAAALAGCASPGGGTRGRCDGNSLCPIVIYEKFPGVFGTYPDYVSVRAVGTTTLLWTFADPSRYKFMANSGTGRPDTVELIGGSTAKEGIRPCFITADSNVPLSIQSEGAYLRCEVTLGSTTSQKGGFAYRVHFHSADGLKAYMVDPTVETTGSNDGGGPRASRGIDIATASVVPVSVGQDAAVPAHGAVWVVWDAGSGNLFRLLGDGVLLSNANGDYGPPCFVASDAGGRTPSASPTRYYACALFDPPALNYVATYFDSITGVKEARGRLVPR